jgi:MOSC domain-containing protein YiiM
VNLDTLRGIRAYRGRREGTLIDFGVYFDVAEPGRVRVGDEVVPL